MPFEIPQKSPEPETKVGRFQHLADAMLRGCAATGPYRHNLCDERGLNTCAYGAMYVGMGIRDPEVLRKLDCGVLAPDVEAMRRAYVDRYGVEIVDDNDRSTFTREEIAARIAAL